MSDSTIIPHSQSDNPCLTRGSLSSIHTDYSDIKAQLIHFHSVSVQCYNPPLPLHTTIL